MNRTRLALLVVLGLLVVGVALSTQVTIFVIQPIGAVPEGRTVIMERTGDLRFIDSADAICERTQGGVSLLCRGAAMAATSENKIYLRLPYSEFLYSQSTGGKVYDR